MEQIRLLLTTANVEMALWSYGSLLAVSFIAVCMTVWYSIVIGRLKKKLDRVERDEADAVKMVGEMASALRKDKELFKETRATVVECRELIKSMEDEISSLRFRNSALLGQLKKRTDECRRAALEQAEYRSESAEDVIKTAKKYYRFLTGKE